MKKSQKAMIREMSKVLTEDIIRMIEDVEAIQKQAEKAERKARAKKRDKRQRKLGKITRKADKKYAAYLSTLDDAAEPIAQWELDETRRLQDEMSY